MAGTETKLRRRYGGGIISNIINIKKGVRKRCQAPFSIFSQYRHPTFVFLFVKRRLVWYDMRVMNKRFTAVYKKSGKGYLGWMEEIPGVNTQGKTLKEVKENLKEALSLVLETNLLVLKKDFGKGKSIREPISISFA